MENHLIEWVSMLLRQAHIITGVAWMGASFYVLSLDNSLTPPNHKADVDNHAPAINQQTSVLKLMPMTSEHSSSAGLTQEHPPNDFRWLAAASPRRPAFI